MPKYSLFLNWKMNLTLSESIELGEKIKKISLPQGTEIILCPSFIALAALQEVFKKSNIILGAQNCWWQDRGAVTGEISPLMLRELSCQYVILGHSERKKYQGETLNLINKKIKAAVAEKIIPVVCIGEEWADREQGRADMVLEEQLKEVLAEINDLENKKIIISYEPFWTISTSGGRLATKEEVAHSCKIIEQALINLYGVADYQKHFKIIYGGTVADESVDDYLDISLVKGFLVGGASLQIDTINKLLKHF